MRSLFRSVLLLCLLGCGHNNEEKLTLVNIQFLPYYRSKAYLEKISFNGEKQIIIDSADLNDETVRLTFKIPAQEESVFQVRIKGETQRLYFITDVPVINIAARPDWKTYHFKNGGINNTLRSFLDQQRKITDSITSLVEELKKSIAPTGDAKVQDSITRVIQNIQAYNKKRDINFADTVSSPGAFLFVYNRIDFAKDFTGTKSFVSKAADRFPAHREVQKLKEETLNFVRIFEEEYNVGDELPDLTLPNQNGGLISLTSLKGSYVFIDCWSSWCAPCFAFIDVKKKMRAIYSNDKLEIVNIALDPEKQEWIQAISSQNIPGIHLIDEKMWKGKALQALKFDSIPFNFFVSSEGRILAKAIKHDSILPLLAKYIQ